MNYQLIICTALSTGTALLIGFLIWVVVQLVKKTAKNLNKGNR